MVVVLKEVKSLNIDLCRFFEGEDKVFSFEGDVTTDSINKHIKEFTIFEPISYKGEIFKVDGEYYLDVDLQYKYKTKCDRCFETTVKEIKTNLSGKLVDYANLSSDYGYDIIYYKKGILDLDENIQMEVVSSLPMKTLCDDDCKGLCPKCGINLNMEACNCQDDDIDPRFEKLRDFFVDK